MNLTQVRFAMLTHASSNIPISSPTNKPNKQASYSVKLVATFAIATREKQNLKATKRIDDSVPFVLRRLSNCAKKPICTSCLRYTVLENDV